RLDDPAARRWLTDHLSGQIAAGGVDVYRNDFNIDPLPFWRGNDAPDRQGMTEIRYIEGLYAMWDELLARHPGLVIDNCSSGGRRIDLETCMRSIPLWRSDTNCSPGHCDWNQSHSCGLSQYVPLHTACAWTPEPYEMRSDATAGLICQWDYRAEGFQLEEAKAALAEAKENQRYWYGDLYPLTPQSVALEHWCAFQLHRADLNEGLVLVFRREQSAYTGLETRLRGLDADTAYSVVCIDNEGNAEESTRQGRELMDGFDVHVPQRRDSLVIRYRPATP
ncbi:MAG: alpha-galactosidase, partial [Candidatus Hydrogenedentes bacterium]|nr:alpha-galactosidase [Candidatus Hydrogenedentota bacterium]